MRLEALRLRGFPTFPEEVSIDFDALGEAMLVAVTGPNGEGKSTLLELALAALDRRCPTRGKIGDLAKARDAFVEARVVNGSTYTIRQVVDAVSGKGEALVTDAAGMAVLPDTLLTSFKVWREKHLPDREVLLASSFLAQGDGGILDMSESDRKRVILRALGIEYYEELAKLAGQRAAAARDRVASAQRAIAELERQPAVAAAEADHVLAIDRAADAERELADARADLERLEAEANAAVEAQRAAAEVEARRVELVHRRDTAARKASDLEERIRNNRTLVERAASIRAAVERDAELSAAIAAAEQELAAWTAKAQEHTRDHGRCTAAAAEASERVRRAQDRIARAKRSLAQKSVIESARERLAEVDQEIEVLKHSCDEARVRLEEARATRFASVEERLSGTRKALVDIHEVCARDFPGPDGGKVDAAHGIAGIAMSTDDAAAAAQAEAPALVADLQRTYDQLVDELGNVEGEARRLRPIAAVDLAGPAAELVDAERDLASAVEEQGRQLSGADDGESAAEDAERAGAAVGDSLRAMRSERDGLRQNVQLAPRLDQAEARIAELQPQFDAACAEMEGATLSLAALPEPTEAPGVPDTAPAETRVRVAEKLNLEAASAVAVFAQKVEAARAAAARLAELAVERRSAEEDLADWNHLAEAFGRDGLQALEIDAAGPEISVIANDLLHDAFGPRFTVRLDTTKLDSKGTRELETFRITCLDTEKGHEGDGKEFSGGERVILNEALSLALTMLACRRSGLQGVTIFRDESGAALDPQKARAYVRMLRRAGAAVGASRILFVTHQADVVPLADARLHVEGGRIEVRPVSEVA